jgi:hypothetical protein
MRRRAMMKGLFGLVLCAVLLCQGAASSDLFYEGNIVVDAVRADVDIGSKADVAVSYTLANPGDRQEQVSLQAAAGKGSPKTVVLAPGQQTDVLFEYSVNIAGDKVKTLSFEPLLLINGKPSAERAGSVAVALTLPAGVPSLISSNKDFIPDETGGNGRSAYYWTAENIYPTTITAKWSTLGVNLAVVKSIAPREITEPYQECTVTLTVANRGGATVQNILLRDTFPTSDFEAVSPKAEFFIRQGNESEQRLFWEKTLPSLPAGQTATIDYRIRYVGETVSVHDFALQPTAVYVDGTLVAASERVTVSQLTGAVQAPEETQTPATAAPLGTYAVPVSLLLAAWLVRSIRKR